METGAKQGSLHPERLFKVIYGKEMCRCDLEFGVDLALLTDLTPDCRPTNKGRGPI